MKIAICDDEIILKNSMVGGEYRILKKVEKYKII